MGGSIVCDGNCENCDFTHWKWIKDTGLLVSSGKISLHNCKKVTE